MSASNDPLFLQVKEAVVGVEAVQGDLDGGVGVALRVAVHRNRAAFHSANAGHEIDGGVQRAGECRVLPVAVRAGSVHREHNEGRARRSASGARMTALIDLYKAGDHTQLVTWICKTYGISLAYASMIRSGKDRMQLQAPGGSAFSFGGLL